MFWVGLILVLLIFSFTLSRHLMEFLEELKKECHWLSSMSTQMCVRCTICLEEHGDDAKRCMRHNKKACLRHDCAHYIPLESKVLCCEPERPLQLDKLQTWIEVSDKETIDS